MNNNELDEKRIIQIRQELSLHSTDELSAIWQENDREVWTDEAFEAIRQLLTERLSGELPHQKDPGAAENHLEQAYASSQAGEIEKALLEVDLALKDKPNWAEAYHFRGLLLEDLEDFAGAVRAYRRALYHDRNNKLIRTDLRRAQDILNCGQAPYQPPPVADYQPPMFLSAPLKVAIGLVTVAFSLGIVITILRVFSIWIHLLPIPHSSSIQPAPSVSPVDYLGFLWIVTGVFLVIFYFIHLIKNQTASENLRYIFFVGLMFIPVVAMPLYYFIYIWTDNPPEWTRKSLLVVSKPIFSETTAEPERGSERQSDNLEGLENSIEGEQPSWIDYQPAMQISPVVRILVGVLTALEVFSLPILFITMRWVLPTLTGETDTQGYFVGFFFLVFCSFGLINSVMPIFYLIHVIKNKFAAEALRVIFGLGCLFLPWIAMPIYYYLFIWRDQPPAWTTK